MKQTINEYAGVIKFKEARKWLNSRKGKKKFESNLKAAKEFTDNLQRHRQIDQITMQDIIDL